MGKKVMEKKGIKEEVITNEELGVSGDYRTKLAAIERMKVVDAIGLMEMRLQHNRISMRANQTVGNLPVAKEFEGIVTTVKMRLDHAKTALKSIDKEYPEAKAKMIELYRTVDNVKAT